MEDTSYLTPKLRKALTKLARGHSGTCEVKKGRKRKRKIKFNRDQAVKKLASMGNPTNRRAYFCQYCKFFHLTSIPFKVWKSYDKR